MCNANAQFSRVLVAVQSLTLRSPLLFLPLTCARVLMHDAREKAMRSSARCSRSSVASMRAGAISGRAGEIPVAHACSERSKTARASNCSNEGGSEGFAPLSSSSPYPPPLSGRVTEVMQVAPSKRPPVLQPSTHAPPLPNPPPPQPPGPPPELVCAAAAAAATVEVTADGVALPPAAGGHAPPLPPPPGPPRWQGPSPGPVCAVAAEAEAVAVGPRPPRPPPPPRLLQRRLWDRGQRQRMQARMTRRTRMSHLS